jgi:hypothetical protein
LRRLFDAAEVDPRIRAFRVRGSMASSTADEFSDLDTRIWVSDDQLRGRLGRSAKRCPVDRPDSRHPV